MRLSFSGFAVVLVFLASNRSEAEAQWGRMPGGGVQVRGLGWFSTSFNPTQPGTYSHWSAEELPQSGFNSIDRQKEYGNSRQTPSVSSYGGRIAPWVPGGGLMTSRIVPSRPLLKPNIATSTGSGKPGAATLSKPTQAGEPRENKD